jgi:hypothetical protein
MADVNQTLAVTSGTDGRVKKHAASPVILAGIKKWRRSGKTTVMRYPHFESSADVQTGTVQANILKGLGENSVSIEGVVNLSDTDQTETGTTGITNGAVVALDLVASKTLSVGYPNVVGVVSAFELGQEIENKVFEFTATVEVDGVFPTWGAVT